MESLLCDEVLLLSSPSEISDHNHIDQNSHNIINDFHMSREVCEDALRLCIEEENNNIIHVPYKSKYAQYLESENLSVARFKSIQWFIKCRNRLNLSLETVFYAANYFDRFMSLNLCNEWKDWTVELLSIACLTIASKFGDTSTNTPTLLEINQINGDDVLEHHYLFDPKTIQRMELVILKALDWRVACITCHSYVEMFSHLINLSDLDLHRLCIINQVNQLLLIAISDTKMAEFKPSVVALSALQCCLDDQFSTSSTLALKFSTLTRFFTQCHKDDLVKCHEMMKKQRIIGTTRSLCNFTSDDERKYSHKSPSSPTTVLLREQINVCDFHVDHSFFKLINNHPKYISEQPRPRKKPKNIED